MRFSSIQHSVLGNFLLVCFIIGTTAFNIVPVVRAENLPSPEELTATLQLHYSGIRFDRQKGFFIQQLQLSNPTEESFVGPLFVVLSELPDEVSLVNNDGTTENIGPLGSPFKTVPLANGISLQAGEKVILTLEFLNPNRVFLTYDLHVFRALTP